MDKSNRDTYFPGTLFLSVIFELMGPIEWDNVAGRPSGQEPLPDTLAIHIIIYIFSSPTKLHFYF